MKITFRRSGGFAPMPMQCVIDTASCSQEDAKQLEALMDSSDIMQAESASIPGARDVRYYLIEIERDGQMKSLKYDELSVPAKAKPLVQFLQSRAQNLFGDE